MHALQVMDANADANADANDSVAMEWNGMEWNGMERERQCSDANGSVATRTAV